MVTDGCYDHGDKASFEESGSSEDEQDGDQDKDNIEGKRHYIYQIEHLLSKGWGQCHTVAVPSILDSPNARDLAIPSRP